MFRIRQTLKGSLWVLPLVGGLLGLGLSNASVWLEGRSFVPHGWDYSTDTALTVLTTVVAASVGLTGFVVTVTVLVVQMATGTFSPRYMRLWYRDSVLKATLAVLVGTLAFSFSLLRRIDENVPDLGVTLAGFFLGAGLVLFLVFLDRCLHRLRPVKVASLVAHAGREALRQTVELASTRRRSGADAELDELLARDADARRPEPEVGSAPGDRRRGPARLGNPPRRRDRDAPRSRGLRLVERRPARGARDGRRSRVSPSTGWRAASRSGSSGRSSRTRPLRSGSSSTSRSGRSRPPSTTRPRRCR